LQYPEIVMLPQTATIARVPPLPIEDLNLVLTQTAALWEEMRGQSLFLAGGTGFFGCWLLESFCHINRNLNLQANVTVLTRDPEAFLAKCPHLANESALVFVKGDIRDFGFPEGNFRYIIHAATETSTEATAAAQLDLLSSITRGTEHLLRFASSRGTSKFLLTSSGAVYGRQPSDMPTEKGNGWRNCYAPFMVPATASNVRSPGAGLSAVRIFGWIATSQSETSSRMHLRVAIFESPVMARRGVLTCMLPI
jgi:nucleoside-diphosphate-sugar epimerase